MATNITHTIIGYAMPLVELLYRKGDSYIKAGVTLSDIVSEEAVQGNLFVASPSEKEKKLMQALDNINFGMRQDAVKFAAAGIRKDWKMRQEKRSRRFTTHWDELCEVS